MGICITAFAMSAAAQTGTGTVPLFSGTTYSAPSNITQLNGNVGIGTTNPSTSLEIYGGSAALQVNDGGEATNLNANQLWSVNTPLYLNYGSSQNVLIEVGGATGNVGIGTTNPMGKLDVNGAGGFVVSDTNLDPTGGYSLLPLENSGKLLLGWNRLGGNGEQDFISNRSAGWSGGFNFYDYTNNGILNSLVTMQGGGNVGIGTTNPAAKLDVNGSINLSGTGASITFPGSGGTQSVAWTGTLCGGDYAESVAVAGDRKNYEPGDVLVIGAETGSDVLKSSEPYSTLVVGVYSTKPGVLGRRQTSDAKASVTEVPMAMVGIVPIKASAENGPIKRGDFLVSSSTQGYAMKGTDRAKMFGAVIGKALGDLEFGTGVIEVVVTLQ